MKLKKKNNSKAYFKSVISLTLSNNENIFFEGTVIGNISETIIGNKGFGFDPIFIPKGQDVTFSQMEINTKNKISHRGIALNHLIKYFTN